MNKFDSIHPDDGMFKGDLNHYNRVGLQAQEIIITNLLSLDPKFKILFLPCGHGRNLRHFLKILPPDQIYASDIVESAVEFMKEDFGVNALTSDTSFSKILDFPKMNIIFVGSLITHLNESDSIKLIKLLSRILKKNGLLILSSHGKFVNSRMGSDFNYGLDMKSAQNIRSQYSEMGYGFASYPYDPNYGISIIRLDWFNKLVRRLGTLRLVQVSEQLWDNHHDIIVLQKK
jgi:SAM-dependent methyltransferase